MIDKILEYKDELGSDTLKSLATFALDPKNIQQLKDNPKLVKTLTNNKLLPSSIRLYIRNIAGVTDKITEDFFSKSELKEIKKRVAEAEAQGSMGNTKVSGQTEKYKDNIIGYSFKEGKLSLAKALTDPAINIDMTLGQASFAKDDKGNFIVTDSHNFDKNKVGDGYDNLKEFKSQKDSSNIKVIPHLDTAEQIDTMLLENQDKPEDSDQEKNYKMFMRSMYEGDGALSNYKENNSAVSYEQPETNKELLARAYTAHSAGEIDSSQLARIIGKLEGTNIPVELDIGSITQEDKYKADSDFARYIAGDTIMGDEYDFAGAGKSYEDVGIPSLIRNNARKFIK
jgi:hypothetical protein